MEPTTTFKDIIQQAIDGDIEGAKDKLDEANNLGCPIDAFGNPKNSDEQEALVASVLKKIVGTL